MSLEILKMKLNDDDLLHLEDQQKAEIAESALGSTTRRKTAHPGTAMQRTHVATAEAGATTLGSVRRSPRAKATKEKAKAKAKTGNNGILRVVKVARKAVEKVKARRATKAEVRAKAERLSILSRKAVATTSTAIGTHMKVKRSTTTGGTATTGKMRVED